MPGRWRARPAIVFVQNVVCNFVAIPLWGADGAAGVALSSARADDRADRVGGEPARRRAGARRARSAAALLAGAALVAVALLVPLPAIAAGALALLAYAGVLVAFEWAAHRDDVRTLPAAPYRFERPDPGPVE